MRIQAAVTLIELLTVITIMALLSGMAIISIPRSQEDAVLAAARQFAATADRCRQLALRTGAPHVLTVNVNNAGNGRVWRNFHQDDDPDFAGRHWYAIIGPAVDRHDRDREPPLAASGNSDSYYKPLLPDYRAAVQEAQVGAVEYVPRGVRFLALSDVDYGSTPANSQRPWYGRYSEDQGRLYAWGGFDPEIDDRTGIQFKSDQEDAPVYDKDLRTMVHPSQVWGQIAPDATARNPGDVGKSISDRGNLFQAVAPYTKRTGPDTDVLPGTPRAVLDGYNLDWALYIDPTGTAYWAGGVARRIYLRDNRDKDRMASFVWEHGGYLVSFCRDIEPEERWMTESMYDWANLDPQTDEPYYERFPSAAAARETMRPWARVFVPRTNGAAQVLTMSHPLSAIDDGEFVE